MKTKEIKLLFSVMLLAVILSGCTLSFNTGAGGGTSSASDGGIFKSLNKGANWAQQALIQTVNVKRNFVGADIISLALDPSDNKAIYAGSLENGLLYSYDGADSWQVAASLGLVTVADVAVDPADKCVIYAAAANKIFKSEDCSRTWAQVYFDNDLRTVVSALAIDQAASRNVFIGTSNGDIIRSSDKAATWRAVGRLDSRVNKIVISPANAKVMFAGTAGRGVFRSINGGESWESLVDKLKDFDGANRFRDLAMVKAEKTTVFLATDLGLLKSADDGNSWSKIELLTAEEEAIIYALAVNPGDEREIYYATGTTFYRSADGGKNWTAKKLPTSRAGAKLLIDPKNPAIIYLAVKQVKK